MCFPPSLPTPNHSPGLVPTPRISAETLLLPGANRPGSRPHRIVLHTLGAPPACSRAHHNRLLLRLLPYETQASQGQGPCLSTDTTISVVGTMLWHAGCSIAICGMRTSGIWNRPDWRWKNRFSCSEWPAASHGSSGGWGWWNGMWHRKSGWGWGERI